MTDWCKKDGAERQAAEVNRHYAERGMGYRVRVELVHPRRSIWGVRSADKIYVPKIGGA